MCVCFEFLLLLLSRVFAVKSVSIRKTYETEDGSGEMRFCECLNVNDVTIFNKGTSFVTYYLKRLFFLRFLLLLRLIEFTRNLFLKRATQMRN